MCCKKCVQALNATNKACFSASTVAEENGKKFFIEKGNLKHESFCKIKVDGCLITNQDMQKCDYVFVRCSNQDIYFVELKGSDVDTAIEQIKSTIAYFKQLLQLEKARIHGYIVSSTVPAVANAKFRKQQFAFKRDVGQELERGTKLYIRYM